MPKQNLRNLKITTSSGTDVTSTSQLSGEAKGKTSAQSETNETVQYANPGSGFSGPYGGKAEYQ